MMLVTCSQDLIIIESGAQKVGNHSSVEKFKLHCTDLTHISLIQSFHLWKVNFLGGGPVKKPIYTT